MKWSHVIWDSMPGGNAEHVEEHGLTTQDVEHVHENYISASFSQATGNPCVFGYTSDDRFIIVIYEEVDKDTIFPVTAYDVPE